MEERSQFFNSSGISIERTKQLLGDPNMSDKEAEKVRDACRTLAEIICDQWIEDGQKGRPELQAQ